MKAIIPVLLILALVSCHEEVTKDVNLVAGKDTYNVAHDCGESRGKQSDFVIAKNDIFDPYVIILNAIDDNDDTDDKTCYYMITCDLCCRNFFYKGESKEGYSEVEVAVSDGKNYHESITIKFYWDPETVEEVSDEDCL